MSQIVTTLKQIRESNIKNHNAPVKKSLRSYKLFQSGNLVMWVRYIWRRVLIVGKFALDIHIFLGKGNVFHLH